MNDPNSRWRIEQLFIRLGAVRFPRTQELVIAEIRSLWGVGLDPGDAVRVMEIELLNAGVLVPIDNNTWDLDRAALASWYDSHGWAKEAQIPPARIVTGSGQAKGQAKQGLNKALKKRN